MATDKGNETATDTTDIPNPPVSNIADNWQEQDWQLAADVSAGEAVNVKEEKRKALFKGDVKGGSAAFMMGNDYGLTGPLQDLESYVLRGKYSPFAGGINRSGGIPRFVKEEWVYDKDPKKVTAEKDKPLDYNKEKLAILNAKLLADTTFKFGNYEHQLNEEERQIVLQARAAHKNLPNSDPDAINKFNTLFNNNWDVAVAKKPDIEFFAQDPHTGNFNYDKFNKVGVKKSFLGLLGPSLNTAEYRKFIETSNRDKVLYDVGVKNLDVRRIFRDHWGGGDMFTETLRMMSGTIEGLGDFAQFAAIMSGGYIKAVLDSAYRDNDNPFGISFDQTEFDASMETTRRNMATYIQDNKENWLNPIFIDDQTTRLNDFIRDKYLETHSAEEYKENRADLLLQPEQVAALYAYDFGKLDTYETMAAFLAENYLTTVYGGKFVGAVSRNSIYDYVKLSRWKNTQVKEVVLKGGKVKYIEPYRLSGILTLADEYLKSEKRQGLIKNLKNKILLRGFTFGPKIQNAYDRIKLVENKIDKKILNHFNNATSSYRSAVKKNYKNPTEANQAALARATERLDLAEEAYGKHLLDVVTKGKTWTPPHRLKALYRDELFPSILQGYIFKTYQGTGSEDTAGALAYISSAFAAPPVVWTGKKVASGIYSIPFKNIGENIEEGVFTIKQTLDLIPIIKEVIGLDNFIDADIMKLQLRDPLSDANLPMGARQYNRLLNLQNTLKQFDPELQEHMIKSFEFASKDQEKIMKIFKNSKIPLPVQKEIMNSLTLSMGQASQLDVLAAYQTKLMYQIRPNDVVKYNARFTQLSKSILENRAMLEAQINVLNVIERSMLELEGKLTPVQYNEIKGIFDIKKAAHANQERAFAQRILEVEDSARLAEEHIGDPRNLIGVNEAKLKITMDALVDMKVAVLNPATVKESLKIVNETFTNLVASHKKSIEEYNNTFVQAKDKSGKPLAVQPTTKAIQTAALKLLNISNEYDEQALKYIYTPLKNLKTPDGKPLKISLFNSAKTKLPKNQLMNRLFNILEAEELTNLTSAMKAGSPLYRTIEGKNIISAANKSAEDALLKYQIKQIDLIQADPDNIDVYPFLFDQETGEALMFEQDNLVAVAKKMLGDIKKEYVDDIIKEYKLPSTTTSKTINNATYYKFLSEKEGIEFEDIEIDFYQLEQFRRYVSQSLNKYKNNTDPSAIEKAKQYSVLLEEVDAIQKQVGSKIPIERPKLDKLGNPIEGTTVTTNAYNELLLARWNAQTLVYYKYDKNQLMDDFSKMINKKTPLRPGRIDKGLNIEPNVINTNIGKRIVQGIISESGAEFEGQKEKLHNLLVGAYGERKVNINDWDTVPITDARKTELAKEGNVEYVIDLRTEKGKLGLAQIQAVFLQAVRELQLHQNVLRRGGTMYNKFKINKIGVAQAKGDIMDSSFMSKSELQGDFFGFTPQEREGIANFLSTNEGLGGKEKYERFQEMFMLKVIGEDGVPVEVQVLNIDQIQKVEQNLMYKMHNSSQHKEAMDNFVTKAKNSIKSNTQSIIKDIEKANTIAHQVEDTLGFDNGETFYTKYFKGAKSNSDTLHRIVADKNQIIEFNDKVIAAREKIQNLQQAKVVDKKALSKARDEYNKVYSEVADEVEKAYRAYLFQAIDFVGGNRKTIMSVKNNGDRGAASALENPDKAFEFADSQIVRDLFEEFGIETTRRAGIAAERVTDIEPTQYDALMGILGHMWMVKEWERAAGSIPGAIPYQGYSDTGLISRAFNYARGMVGGPYLAVEAGFKIMKDHDLSVLYWMLQDKEAAAFMHKALLTKDPISSSEISTFVDRMAGWIAREVVAEGGQLASFDAEEVKRLIEEAENDPLADTAYLENKFSRTTKYGGLTGAALASATVAGIATVATAAKVGDVLMGIPEIYSNLRNLDTSGGSISPPPN